MPTDLAVRGARRDQRDAAAPSSDAVAAVQAGFDADGRTSCGTGATVLTEAMKASTVNRMCKALKAALNLAASHDDRITNAKAWTVGLAAIPEDDDTESNLVLTDDQRRDVVAAAYAISAGVRTVRRGARRDRRAQRPDRAARCRRSARRQRTEADDAVELAEGQEPQDANPKADADRAQPGEAAEGRPQPDAMPASRCC